MRNLKDINTVIIVGAGLAGCVAANRFAAMGKSVIVYDSEKKVGGASSTTKVSGVVFHDNGPHIFHTSDKEVWDFVNEYCDMLPYINSPIANYKGDLYNLPFNMNTFVSIFKSQMVRTPDDAKRVISSEIKKYEEDNPDFDPNNPKNLEEKAISMVGTTIYEKLVKGYTQKQWNSPCNELPASIINRLPLRFVFDNNYFNDIYQGIPSEGYTDLCSRLLSDYCKNSENNGSIKVQLEKEVTLKDLKELQDKHSNLIILYSGALDKLLDYKFGRLPFRTLKFENRIVTKSQGVAVMNYTDSDTPYTRITEHNLFDYRNRNKEDLPILQSLEYPCSDKDGIPYYPIQENELYVKYVKELIVSFNYNFFPIGRAGTWQYMDMHTIVRSMLDFCKVFEKPDQITGEINT